MLKRFCLYGFLKNQRYFEPFLWLAFLEKGLSYSQIGFLIGFREVAINALMDITTRSMFYQYGDSAEKRAEAVRKWREWWARQGLEPNQEQS